MAETEGGQEKTEEPTERRKQKAKEKGQIARSKELTSLLILLFCLLGIYSTCDQLFIHLSGIFNELFPGELYQSISNDIIYNKVIYSFQMAFSSVIIILLLGYIGAIAGQVLVGGWNFNFSSINVNLEKLNPIGGIKKIFSLNSTMEMIKAFLKFLIISSVSLIALYSKSNEIIALSNQPFNSAVINGLSILFFCVLSAISSILFLVFIDVPYQIWSKKNQLKMSKQEIKDEIKETHGSPEIKSRIKRIQRELSQKRMMENVPNADVVITNPTHFSVALKYNENENRAPIVVAKGSDHLALKIREIAKYKGVCTISIPLLSRAIYYSTEIDQEIPFKLYKAVAQVLAYVYQLKRFEEGKGYWPGPIPKVNIND